KGMVKRAVGFDAERGDEIDVANVPFKVQPGGPLPPLAAPDFKDMLTSPMGIGVGAGAALLLGAIAFFLFRGKKKPAPQPEALAAAPAAETTAAAVQEEMAAAAQKITVGTDPRKEQLAQIAHDYHDVSVRLIRMWLQEDAAKARVAGANGANA